MDLPAPDHEKLLTADELAAKLGGVKKSTILTWRTQGIITAEIVSGRIIRFSEARVREELRAAANKPPADTTWPSFPARQRRRG